MKKIFNWLVFIVMALVVMGCSKREEIVFDHEKPAFEIKDGKILLEVIVPSTTKENDIIYISGPFNGGDEVAENDVTWHLEKSAKIDKKWGIYLDPSTFVQGKTLADGYRFVSAREGEERTARNEAVNRTDNPAPGTMTNIYVAHWEMYFYEAPDIKHDGPVVYVDDQTGWDALAMYAWGDKEAFGDWPGIQPTGTEVKNGKTWKYFDCGEDNKGLNLNLIFNNNNGGKQLEDYKVTLDQDEYFLVITADGVQTDNSLPEHEGTIRVYVDNQAGWEAVALYQWGDKNDLGGSWPGQQPAGTAKIAGVDYTYFEFAISEVEGLTQNLIFNNNNGGVQTPDQNVKFSADVVDLFYVIFGEKDCAVIEDPFNREPIETPEPNPEPQPDPDKPAESVPVCFYVQNNTDWTPLYMYAWADKQSEIVGKWPGVKFEETVTLGGETYFRHETTASAYELDYHPIFNDGNGGEGKQYDAPAVKIAKYNFIKAGKTSAEVVETPKLKVYVDDQTGWEKIQLYSWGGVNDLLGTWPGATPVVEKVDGKDYKVFEIPANGFGTSSNFIFNNKTGDEGVQLPDYNMTIDRDVYFSVTAEGVTLIK